jgi:impB/mucB/samB family protein
MCCLDLDTFFVSVERLLDPSLCGKPVVVGGSRGGRGGVTSASYEVRAFGVRSGMSIREASERAPRDAVFVPGHHDEYSDYSKRARDIVERFSPIVIAAQGSASTRSNSRCSTPASAAAWLSIAFATSSATTRSIWRPRSRAAVADSLAPFRVA